jgi:hypothetical protein
MWGNCLHTMCNVYVTHKLLVIGQDMMRWLPYRSMQCHSLAVGHRKRCDDTAFNKNLKVSHMLSVIGNKHISITTPQKYLQFYSHTVGKILISSSFEQPNQHDMLLTFYVHRRICDFTAFMKHAISLTSCRTKNLSKFSCSRVASTTHFLLQWN